MRTRAAAAAAAALPEQAKMGQVSSQIRLSQDEPSEAKGRKTAKGEGKSKRAKGEHGEAATGQGVGSSDAGKNTIASAKKRRRRPLDEQEGIQALMQLRQGDVGLMARERRPALKDKNSPYQLNPQACAEGNDLAEQAHQEASDVSQQSNSRPAPDTVAGPPRSLQKHKRSKVNSQSRKASTSRHQYGPDMTSEQIIATATQDGGVLQQVPQDTRSNRKRKLDGMNYQPHQEVEAALHDCRIRPQKRPKTNSKATEQAQAPHKKHISAQQPAVRNQKHLQMLTDVEDHLLPNFTEAQILRNGRQRSAGGRARSVPLKRKTNSNTFGSGQSSDAGSLQYPAMPQTEPCHRQEPRAHPSGPPVPTGVEETVDLQGQIIGSHDRAHSVDPDLSESIRLARARALAEKAASSIPHKSGVMRRPRKSRKVETFAQVTDHELTQHLKGEPPIAYYSPYDGIHEARQDGDNEDRLQPQTESREPHNAISAWRQAFNTPKMPKRQRQRKEPKTKRKRKRDRKLDSTQDGQPSLEHRPAQQIHVPQQSHVPEVQQPQERFTNRNHFGPEELLRLEKFRDEWCAMNRKSRREFNNLAQANIRQNPMAVAMFRSIQELFPNHQPSYVQRFCRRKFHNFHARGVWSPDEDNRLRDAVAEKGPSWSVVGKMISRFPEDCRDRWRNYLSNAEYRNREQWTEAEVLNLASAIVDCIECMRQERQMLREEKYGPDVLCSGGDENNPDSGASLINWAAVSARMGRYGGGRSRLQCSFKWGKMKPEDRDRLLFQVYTARAGLGSLEAPSEPVTRTDGWRMKQAAKKVVHMRNGDKFDLLQAMIQSGAPEEGNIPWKTIGESWWQPRWTTTERKAGWIMLKQQIPESEKMDYRDVIYQLLEPLYHQGIEDRWDQTGWKAEMRARKRPEVPAAHDDENEQSGDRHSDQSHQQNLGQENREKDLLPMNPAQRTAEEIAGGLRAAQAMMLPHRFHDDPNFDELHHDQDNQTDQHGTSDRRRDALPIVDLGIGLSNDQARAFSATYSDIGDQDWRQDVSGSRSKSPNSLFDDTDGGSKNGGNDYDAQCASIGHRHTGRGTGNVSQELAGQVLALQQHLG